MLTDTQRANARYHGGKEIANRKRSITQAKTVLQRIRNECRHTQGDLHGLLPEQEIDKLTAACEVVDRIIDELERNVGEARRIKASYEKRVLDTLTALQAAVPRSVANVVALLSINRDEFNLCHIAEDCKSRWGGAHRTLDDRYRDTLSALAHSFVRNDKPTLIAVAEVKAALPTRIEKLAPLITEINTIAVAQELERANRMKKAA